VVMLTDLPGKWFDCDPNVWCGNTLVSVGAKCSPPPPEGPIIIEPSALATYPPVGTVSMYTPPTYTIDQSSVELTQDHPIMPPHEDEP